MANEHAENLYDLIIGLDNIGWPKTAEIVRNAAAEIERIEQKVELALFEWAQERAAEHETDTTSKQDIINQINDEATAWDANAVSQGERKGNQNAK